MGHLVEWSHPIPEVRNSNSVIGKKNLYWTFVYCQLCIEKMKIKKKRPGMAHFLKKEKERKTFVGKWCIVSPENTHCQGKYRCTACLQFNIRQKRKYVVICVRAAIQWYFLLEWLFSGWSVEYNFQRHSLSINQSSCRQLNLFITSVIILSAWNPIGSWSS